MASLLSVPLEGFEVCLDNVIQGKPGESVETTLDRIRCVLGLPIPMDPWRLPGYLAEAAKTGKDFGQPGNG